MKTVVTCSLHQLPEIQQEGVGNIEEYALQEDNGSVQRMQVQHSVEKHPWQTDGSWNFKKKKRKSQLTNVLRMCSTRKMCLEDTWKEGKNTGQEMSMEGHKSCIYEKQRKQSGGVAVLLKHQQKVCLNCNPGQRVMNNQFVLENSGVINKRIQSIVQGKY